MRKSECKLVMATCSIQIECSDTETVKLPKCQIQIKTQLSQNLAVYHQNQGIYFNRYFNIRSQWGKEDYGSWDPYVTMVIFAVFTHQPRRCWKRTVKSLFFSPYKELSNLTLLDSEPHSQIESELCN